MKLTKAFDYGMRLMIYLARNEKDAISSIRSISQDIDIPKSFLANIVHKLAGAEYIETVKGSHGGLRLKVAPDELTAFDIYQTLEGDIMLTSCQKPNGCKHECYCGVRPLAEKVNDSIRSVLSDTSLKELVEKSGGKTWGKTA